MPKSGRTAWQLSRYHQSLYPRKNHVLSVVSLHSLTECVHVCVGARMCMCVYVCAHVYVYAHVCVCARTQAGMHAQECLCI